MKYIKNYDSLNIFKKSISKDVIKLADKIKTFIANNYNKKVYVINNGNLKNSKEITVIDIVIDENDDNLFKRSIGLYYNSKYNNRLMYSNITSIDCISGILLFLTNIILKYSNEGNDNNYFIKISDIDKIISDINQESFDIFKNTEKYNL